MQANFELEESQRLLCEAWTTIFGRCSPQGRVFDAPGLRLIDSGQPWVFANASILTEPVASTAELHRHASAAIEHFQASGNKWFFSASEEWLGPEADSLLSSLGLVRALDVTGMVAKTLLHPSRPLPDVEVRMITDEPARVALAELNAEAYAAPLDWGRMAIGHEQVWREPLFGHLAYVDGQPAAGGFATPIEDALYVAFVATAAQFRGRGLAELVIRRSLVAAAEATGLERTVLHATASGLPLYQRMGYRPVATFPIWEPSP